MQLKSLFEDCQTKDTQKDEQITMNHVLEFEQVLLKNGDYINVIWKLPYYEIFSGP